jgi:DNA polymerase I-like protein with 3'-5' exonuclease and polymerase domains
MRVWDTQLFEHFASNTTWVFPDLKTAAEKRGLELKKVVEIEEYWDNGVDTHQIPWEIVETRVVTDVELTYRLYLAQIEEYNTWSRARQNLFKLQCQDLLVLQQIERNGLYYDEKESQAQADATLSRLLELSNEIYELIGDRRININSDEHLSAILYGGSIKHETKVPNGVFKSGQKEGQTRYRWEEETVTYQRRVQPLESTESAKTKEQIKLWKLEGKSKQEISELILKTGIWSTDRKILGRILWDKLAQRTEKLIRLLLDYSAENRALTSYLTGLPNLITKMNWPRNILHGSINQVVVRTGRTSSSKPNLQNFDGDLKVLFTTRFPCRLS